MQNVKFGNILDLQHDVYTSNPHQMKYIVHGCNAQGVMGSGIAKQVRNEFPSAYQKYVEVCKNFKNDWSMLGGLIIPCQVRPDLCIVNAFTQEHFGRDKCYISYKAISGAFEQLAMMADDEQAVVNYPLIGAGLGGGDWAIISNIIEAAFQRSPSIERNLWIYEERA